MLGGHQPGKDFVKGKKEGNITKKDAWTQGTRR